MTAIKTGLVALGALILLLPLGLLGLGAATQQATNQTCTPATPPPSPSVPPPGTPAATASAGGPAGCDGGDGLPDTGTGGIPTGYVFPRNTQEATAVAFALNQLGKPYVFGTDGPDTYDCSGLVMTAWAAAGVTIPRTTTDQVNVGVAVTSLSAMQPGDLIFIPGSDGTMTHPGHVGMYIGRDSSGRQWLVQAPHTGTVIHTTPVSDWTNQIAAIRRPVTSG